MQEIVGRAVLADTVMRFFKGLTVACMVIGLVCALLDIPSIAMSMRALCGSFMQLSELLLPVAAIAAALFGAMLCSIGPSGHLAAAGHIPLFLLRGIVAGAFMHVK
jgi:hypothetical protein